VPTSAIEDVSSKYAMNLDDVGAVLISEATILDTSAPHTYAYAEAVFTASPACL
jgi:hypothetical protein